MIKIRSADYLELIRYVSNDETRFFLNGFYVDKISKEEIVLVATNGKSLAILRITPDKKFKVKDFKSLEDKIIPRSKDLPIRKYDNVFITKEFNIAVGNNEPTLFQKIEFIEGKFPNWKQVMPKQTKDDKIILLNPEYMPKKTEYIEFRINKSLKKAVTMNYHIEDGSDFEAIIMPIEK